MGRRRRDLKALLPLSMRLELPIRMAHGPSRGVPAWPMGLRWWRTLRTWRICSWRVWPSSTLQGGWSLSAPSKLKGP